MTSEINNETTPLPQENPVEEEEETTFQKLVIIHALTFYVINLIFPLF